MSIVKWKGYILYDSKNMTFWKGWKSWYSKMIHFQGLRVGGELKRQIKKDFLSNEKYSVTLQWWIHVIIHMPRPTESVQSLSHVHLFENPWTAARQASLSIINSQSLFKLMSIELVMPSNHLILCHLLLLLPLIFPSIRVFSNESVLCIRWPKYWSFSFNISPPNEYSGLISFRIDWFDLLAVQGTLL